MTLLGQIVLMVYALLMFLGGFMGYRAGSKVSLRAGVGSGVALLGGGLVSLWKPSVGIYIGAVVSLALCAVFAVRVARTKKFMPAGMLLLVSVVALALLVWSALMPSASAPRA